MVLVSEPLPSHNVEIILEVFTSSHHGCIFIISYCQRNISCIEHRLLFLSMRGMKSEMLSGAPYMHVADLKSRYVKVSSALYRKIIQVNNLQKET